MAIMALCALMTSLADASPIYPAFELQGHRGARGLAPENLCPPFT